jgi:hypothetical protein
MENPKCQKCGTETAFLGYDPTNRQELCIKCYNNYMSQKGKSDGMTSPIKLVIKAVLK